MEENTPSKNDEKPFSVIERFRQLKKVQEQPTSPDEKTTPTNSSGTVFRASTSSQHFPNGDVSGGSSQGRYNRKRSSNESGCERPSKRIAAYVPSGQKEVDCGITEYLREGPGFNVIIKSRYTDFQVNEIDYEGNVVRLTSTELVMPSTDEPEPPRPAEDFSAMPAEKWEALQNIINDKLSTTVDIDVTDLKKEERQHIHKAVKKKFGPLVCSNTNDIDGRKVLQLSFAAKEDVRNSNWPKERPQYLHFVLFKENSDMSEAINTIARHTHIRPNKFSYAGTKDKRGATSQWVCVRRTTVEKFKGCARLRGIALGNFCYKWKQLRLGDLKGNRFKLVLRNVKASDDEIREAVEHLKSTGFINYFGLQRFGNSMHVPTYAVGKAVLKGDWKLAVELILKPRPGEATFRDVKEARDIWWESRNATDALKPLHRKDKSIEGQVLLGLRKHGPNAYQNAFDNLPRQIGTMYLHSYQSLIWNQIVSRRVREFGLKVLPGDLVKVNVEDTPDDKDTSTADEEEMEVDSNQACDQAVTEFGEGRIQVRALSEQETAEATIYDVLYPLPGDDIRLPDNQVADWYKELLQADGFSMSSFGSVHRKYGMYGSYRYMLEKPGDMSWHTLRYSDPDEDLLLTELAVLRERPPLPLDPEGPLKAVVLEFNLSVCCYATMVVRELAKCDTSTSNQASLSAQAREESKQKQEEPLSDTTTSNQALLSTREESKQQQDEHLPDTNTNGDCSKESVAQTKQETDKLEELQREAAADNLVNKFLDTEYH